MNAPRFIQNFKNRRAIVVSRDSRALEALDQMLMKLGLSVSYVPLSGDRAALEAGDLDCERDILLVDGDLNNPLDLPVSAVSETTVVPIIGLVGIEAPSRLKGLFQLGATAILRKPVHGAIVYSALVLAVNAYQRQQQMEASIALHEERRRQRRSVIKAIVEIMRIHGVDDDQAYDLLRRESMKARLSVEAFSEHFVRQMDRSAQQRSRA
jgi:AmiR/NasT family two-component response regulator